MALAAEPAVTGKLSGDSGGRGGTLYLPNLEPHTRRQALAWFWPPRHWTPLPKPESSLKERAGPTGPASPPDLSCWLMGQENSRSKAAPAGSDSGQAMPLHQDLRFFCVWLWGLCFAQCLAQPTTCLTWLSSSQAQLPPAVPRMWLLNSLAPSHPLEAPCQRGGATHSQMHGNTRR